MLPSLGAAGLSCWPTPSYGASLLLKSLCGAFHWLRHVFADVAYAGETNSSANWRNWATGPSLVTRSDAAKGFVLLPRRPVVECSIAWLHHKRRLAKDFEATIESATTRLYIASARLMTRGLATACECRSARSLYEAIKAETSRHGASHRFPPDVFFQSAAMADASSE